jgi:adenylate cyclase class IV
MQYEVELKSLISNEQDAMQLPERIRGLGHEVVLQAEHKQLNDYFINGDLSQLVRALGPHLGPEKTAELVDIADRYSDFTVRARQNNETVLFIVKAAMDGGSANHSNQRIEFETSVDIAFEDLSRLIQQSGYDIEARWQADRKIYAISNGITLDSFFSPGYGHVAEFEMIVHDKAEVEDAERQLRAFAAILSLEEVDKELLEKMFVYYNEHWREYYGTVRTFSPEDI